MRCVLGSVLEELPVFSWRHLSVRRSFDTPVFASSSLVVRALGSLEKGLSKTLLSSLLQGGRLEADTTGDTAKERRRREEY